MFDKHTFRALLWALTAFLIILMIGNKLLPTPPARDLTTPPVTQDPTTPTGEGWVDSTPPIAPVTPREEGVGGDVPAAPGHGFVIIDEDPDEQIIEIGSVPGLVDDADGSAKREDPYSMHVQLSNVGASVQTVTLSDHLESLDSDDPYKLLDKVGVEGGRFLRSLSVMKIVVDRDAELPLADAKWRVEKSQSDEGWTVSFSLTIGPCCGWCEATRC